MTDSMTPLERSHRMGLIRGKNTAPELTVRRVLHGMGYRYKLHSSDLQGKPDIVLPRYKAVIFVHGCFWHRHSSKSCKLSRLPKSRTEFWIPKLEANRLRDHKNRRLLAKAGWKSLVVWECQLNNIGVLKNRLSRFLRQE